MPDVETSRLEKTIGHVLTASSVLGAAFVIVGMFDSSPKKFWGFVLFTIAAGYIAWRLYFDRTYENAPPARIRTYHPVLSFMVAFITLGLSGSAIFTGLEWLHEHAESQKLVSHARKIEQHKTLASEFGNDKIGILIDTDNGPRIDLMPFRVYFELLKNPKVDYARVEAVTLAIKEHRPLPKYRIEQMIITRHVPTIQFAANLANKEPGKDDTQIVKCRPIGRIDVDAVYLDEKLPHPFSVLIDAHESGLYTIECEAIVSNRNTIATCSVGSIILAKLPPELPMKFPFATSEPVDPPKKAMPK